MDVLNIITTAFLAAVGTGLLTLTVKIIKWVDGKRVADKKKEEANNVTIKALVHDAYFRQARYLLAKDEITDAELENHNYLYEAYHVQGLNGTGDTFHDLVREKPIIVNSIDANKLP